MPGQGNLHTNHSRNMRRRLDLSTSVCGPGWGISENHRVQDDDPTPVQSDSEIRTTKRTMALDMFVAVRGRVRYCDEELIGSGPPNAGMAELADAADSKSADPCGHGGSTPPPGTIK